MSEMFTTLAVPDEKLEPVGYDKVDRRGRHAAEETSHLVYSLPREWLAPKMSPILRRERMVLRLSDWARHKCVTPQLVAKLINGPLSQSELQKYSSNQIARLVYAVGNIKKANQLIGDARIIQNFLEDLLKEATDRKRLMTYDGAGLAQAAYGLSLMQLEKENVLRVFAEEAVKPHRIRNSFGKSVVNLLDALYGTNYQNEEHVRILSDAVVQHLGTLPGFTFPRLLRVWAHFNYQNREQIHAVLAEVLKEQRLNVMLASHLEEILCACAKLKLQEPKVITLLVRELIYSQKWKLMHHGCLPRIIQALGELQHETPTHWQHILSAALDSETVAALESNMLVDIYMGWSKVAFRDSQLLEQLGIEAMKAHRMKEYSTRQLFEIFKAQRALGQLERVYAEPVIDRLKDTEKLMKCNVETKIKIFMFPRIKKTLGMKNVASLAKEIFQPMCLERWSSSVLISLATTGLAPLGPRFNICFAVVVRELSQEKRIKDLTTHAICSLLLAWEKLEFKNAQLQKFIAECTREGRIQLLTEQELLMLIWRLTALADGGEYEQLTPLFVEATRRMLSVFTGKGLTMLLSCLKKTKCLTRDELQPIVGAVTTEEKLKQLDASLSAELISALTEFECEEALQIVKSRESVL